MTRNFLGSSPDIEGECPICGHPGVVGQYCPDPDCGGTIISLREFEYLAPKDNEYPEEYLHDEEPLEVLEQGDDDSNEEEE
jgi:hypothetical protein